MRKNDFTKNAPRPKGKKADLRTITIKRSTFDRLMASAKWNQTIDERINALIDHESSVVRK